MSATSSLDAPLEEFHLFPKLPIELRFRIWGFAAPEPRIITQLKNKKPKKTHCCRVPAILRACRESRYEYLADPKSPISKRGHPTYQLINIKYAVYFSFEIDTLYVTSEGCCGFFDEGMIPHLQYIAIDFEHTPTRQVLEALVPILKADPKAINLKLLSSVIYTDTFFVSVKSKFIQVQSGSLNLSPRSSPNVVTQETKTWYAGWNHHEGFSLVPQLAIEPRNWFRSSRSEN